jgi:methyl-accepting chemotaxis protein
MTPLQNPVQLGFSSLENISKDTDLVNELSKFGIEIKNKSNKNKVEEKMKGYYIEDKMKEYKSVKEQYNTILSSQLNLMENKNRLYLNIKLICALHQDLTNSLNTFKNKYVNKLPEKEKKKDEELENEMNEKLVNKYIRILNEKNEHFLVFQSLESLKSALEKLIINVKEKQNILTRINEEKKQKDPDIIKTINELAEPINNLIEKIKIAIKETASLLKKINDTTKDLSTNESDYSRKFQELKNWLNAFTKIARHIFEDSNITDWKGRMGLTE